VDRCRIGVSLGRQQQVQAGACRCYMGWLMHGSSRGQGSRQARLHSLTSNKRVASKLAAVAADLRRQPIEFAVETVAVRDRVGRVAAPAWPQVIK
jgi:hypothetical protein